MKRHRRPGTYILLGSALLLACGFRAQANGIIHDPAMGVEKGDFSSMIYQGVNFVPLSGGGGVFGFYNGASQNITQLLFDIDIQPNLDPSVVAQAFTCDQGNLNPFFYNCNVQYVQSTGQLGIAFYGTNQPPAPGTVTPADEAGLHDGIPPLLSGCSTTPDATGCNDVGHFAITLNNNFSLSGSSGGWNNTNSPGLFLNSGVTITAAVVSTTYYPYTGTGLPADLDLPEPGTSVLIGGALLALGLMARRRRRSAAFTCAEAARIPPVSKAPAGAPLA
ncbi:MAG TPA: PEP-CTERM sorting domain-containing protein [Bryobacteraceae bacterium]|nr:PEP-CTERM sorting domain-containing protein [Bryobacteraceae bacterium]